MRVASFSLCACLLIAVSTQAQTSSWSVPRTPWGDPDLQGIWPSTSFVSVPMQRPPQFGTRNRLTDEEMAQRAKQELTQKEGFERDGAGGPTGAPGHWLEWGTTQRQASLIVEPADGRMPPMTTAARERLSSLPTGTFGTKRLDGPLDFTMWERCLSRGVPGPPCRCCTTAASTSGSLRGTSRSATR